MVGSKRFYRNKTMEEMVELAMEESGIKFTAEVLPELQEISGKTIFNQRIRQGDGVELEFTNPSKLLQISEGAANLTGRLAGFSGKATIVPKISMLTVENFNRRQTYKLGFFKMYDSLNKSDRFREMLTDKWKGVRKRDITDKEFKAELFRRSKNYAERMTNLLHFDYSTVSKSKIMRSPVGRFLFQFQHYAHKFAEYNFKLGRDARHQLFAGEWNNMGDVGKGFRMGLAYFAAPALLSALTGNDWSRVIQHDSAQRIAQWWTFFTGDEEEFKKATYGRGAIGAMIGAPVLSDFLALGELAELWDLEDHEWLEMAMGYNDMSNVSNDVKIRKLSNIVNVQAGRLVYQTSGLVWDGHLGTALQFEVGAYPTSSAKKHQEVLIDAVEMLPKPLNDALKAVEEHIGKSRKGRRSKQSKNQKHFLFNP
jgi:hypothetical protein